MFILIKKKYYNINLIKSFDHTAFATVGKCLIKESKTHGQSRQNAVGFVITFIDESSIDLRTRFSYDSYPEYEKHVKEIKDTYNQLFQLRK